MLSDEHVCPTLLYYLPKVDTSLVHKYHGRCRDQPGG